MCVARHQQTLTQRKRRPFCLLTMHLGLFKSILFDYKSLCAKRMALGGKTSFAHFLKAHNRWCIHKKWAKHAIKRLKNLAIKAFGLRFYFFAFGCAAFGCGFSKSAYRLESANSLRASFICLSLTSMCLMRPFWK